MRAKVAFASFVIAVVLIVGGAMMFGAGDSGGFREGVQESKLCQEQPDHWWCEMWDGK